MIQNLESSITEKDVENLWRQKISSLIPNSNITSPYNTDGYLETEDGKITLLLEFKFEENLKSKLAQVNVLSQTLYYLKKFEKDGKKLPKVIVIADKNECFILHSNPLSKYLDYDLNWNAPASTAFKTNPDLISDMLSDNDINPFVFDIITGFNFAAIKNKIVELSENVKRLIKVTEHNINNVFEYFQKNVLGKNALSVNEVANLFINLIINPGENYLHPKRKNILISKSFGDVYVQTDKFISFFSHFDGEQYSVREKEKLTAIVDRIVEDETRRRKGEFFTPTIWVDEAHKMITEAFGENWKEEYIVWDPACGTLNLTRDYKFKELYCSTIEESDIKTADQMKYNPEAVKFQYDFLNDGVVDGKIDIENDPKLPDGLKLALLEGKKIIVLMNPPYGEAKGDSKEGKITVGSSNTYLSNLMNSKGLGYSTRQLYTQFIFKVLEISKNNIKICFFSNGLYKTSVNFHSFREYFLTKYKFKNGMLFNASHFASVSQDWAIDFSIWINEESEKKDTFTMIKKDLSDNFEIINLGEIIQYNTDNEVSSSDWIREKIKPLRLIDTIQLKTAISPFQSNINRIAPESIGYLLIKANKVKSNMQEVGLYTSATSNRGGVSLIHENFKDGIGLFSARKLIQSNWVNVNDEYLKPDTNNINYENFTIDSLVYSLFNSHSMQSSLRQIKYKEKLWDIKNEFFWMSKSEIMELAEKKFFDDVYRDARSSDERYVYTLLHKEGIYEKLSPDAKEVLDMATELVKKSFAMRQVLHEEHPEYHLNTWDAGWYQIKLILKQFYLEDLKTFTKKYKEFEDRMRPLVYELGFLRK